MNKTKAEKMGEILGIFFFNTLESYWFLFTINTLLDKNYPYTISYILSAYFVVTFLKYILKK